MSRILLSAIAVPASIVVLACQRDYRFDVTARYEATRSHYQLSVHAVGVVRAGDDLSGHSRADVTISPIAAAGSRIEFSVALPDAPPRNAAIAKRLTDAGYNADSEELAESIRAIGGALGGPKATLLDGQTRVLRVLQVSFRR